MNLDDYQSLADRIDHLKYELEVTRSDLREYAPAQIASLKSNYEGNRDLYAALEIIRDAAIVVDNALDTCYGELRRLQWTRHEEFTEYGKEASHELFMAEDRACNVVGFIEEALDHLDTCWRYYQDDQRRKEDE